MDCIVHEVVKSQTRLSDFHFHLTGFRGGSVGKQSACSAGDPGLIPGLGRSPGERKGYPLQYACGECHGQRSVAGYSPWDCRVGRDCEINFHFHC